MTTMEIKNLTKRFGRQPILDDINLTVNQNGIYGLLGRNGVGKSTLLHLITDGIQPTNGIITVDGQTVKNNGAVLHHLWLMNATMPFGRWVSVKETMKWAAAVYGNFDYANAHRMLATFGVAENAHVGRLSTGQQTSLKLVLALNVNCQIILLDEPVLGLDANHREFFYSELMRTYGDRPRIFMIATHLIDEVANLLDHVIILNDHRVQIADTTDHVLAKAYRISGPADTVTAYTRGLNVIATSSSWDKLTRVVVYDHLPTDRDVPSDLAVSHLDLQSLFIALTSVDVNHVEAKEADHHE